MLDPDEAVRITAKWANASLAVAGELDVDQVDLAVLFMLQSAGIPGELAEHMVDHIRESCARWATERPDASTLFGGVLSIVALTVQAVRDPKGTA